MVSHGILSEIVLTGLVLCDIYEQVPKPRVCIMDVGAFSWYLSNQLEGSSFVRVCIYSLYSSALKKQNISSMSSE